MKTIFALATAAFALSATSCYYGTGYSYTQTRGGGYGHSGYSSGSSTSFVYTSSDSWIYDPVVRCYYDRRRHAYYDPYLYGYYPRGYTPRPVAYVPHPYGWNGHGRIAPPRTVKSHNLTRYQHRHELLRERNYAWARKHDARPRDVSRDWQRQRARAAANFDGSHSRETTRPSRGQGARQTPDHTKNSANRGNAPHIDRGSSIDRARSTTSPRTRQRVRPSTDDRRRTPDPAASRPGYNQPVNTNVQHQRATQKRAAQQQAAQRQAAQQQAAQRRAVQRQATQRQAAQRQPNQRSQQTRQPAASQPRSRPTHRGQRGSTPIQPQPSRSRRSR